ncbi:MAG: glycosyltransferase family 1 protein [Patescibacteria group bacterium]|jgi:glycosyltransferase involved in cell wall biosynthesis
MRIGIDCRNILSPELGEQAGIGHYTAYLVQHLLQYDTKNTYVLFFDHRVKDTQLFAQYSNVEIRRFPFSRYKKFLPITYAHGVVPKVLSNAQLDVFHAPANILPLSYHKPSVITIHDLAIYREPTWFPRQVLSTSVLVPRSLREADRIIAVSESTADDIQMLFNIPSKKISVIYEGVEEFKRKRGGAERVKKKCKLTKPYFLFVGTLEPRKNLPHAIQAYARFVRREGELASETEFLIVGAKGYRHEDVTAMIKQEKMQRHVRLLGYVSQEEKVELMKGAIAFVFPSLYEGFGLPVLEAMQLGTPVIASDTSSLSEIIGRSGMLVNAEDVSAMTRAMGSMLVNPKFRIELARRGKRKAQQFSWERTARETLKVYQRVERTIKHGA